MGQLKDEAMKGQTEDIQEHQLLDSEMNYIRLLNMSLQYHTMGQKIVSGFVYYVATTRLGYADGSNLMFEIDFDNPKNVLLIKLMPADITNAQVEEEVRKNQDGPQA